MNVHDIVLSAPENLLELLLEIQADSKAGMRSVNEHRLTATQPDDVRIVRAALDVRRDDVYVMSKTPRFTRKEVDVLADPAEVRVVVLGYECDAKWTCERWRQRRQGRRGGEIYIAREISSSAR